MGYSFKRAHRDANQGEIVAALERAGAFVIDLSMVGGGVPDLLVARHGSLYWCEVKNPETKNGRVSKHDGLTDAEIDWLAAYGTHGPKVNIVTTPEEALRVVCATEQEVHAALSSAPRGGE